jgi:hypothetical protein
MPPAGPVHWPVYIGTRWTRTLTWYSSKAQYDADPTTASKVDLTSYTGQAIMRRKEGDTAAVLTFSTDDDSLTLGGTNGTITFLLGGDVVSTSTDPGKYVLDLILTNGSAQVLEPPIEAVLEFIPTVTLQ